MVFMKYLNGENETNNRQKITLLTGFALLTVISFQWLHFSFYYQQPIKLSLIWSVVDWSLWFIIAGIFYSFGRCRQRRLSIYEGGIFVLMSGPFQIIIASLIYQIIFNSEQSLIDAFVHMMNKRWLQNLFLGLVFLLLILLLIKSKVNSERQAKNAETNTNNPLILNDGKSTHLLKVEDIYSVNSAKNYLSVFTQTEEIVIRSSLKSLKTQLPEMIFVQISRSVIVNKAKVERLEKYSRTSSRVIMANDQQHNVGRTYLSSISNIAAQ